ncbi:MAG: alpha/beta hydrolase-fold protein [Chitinophagaceae bacterium]
MKFFPFSILIVFLFFNSSAQTDNKIVIGNIDSIQSMVLNEKRKIWIYVPSAGTNDVYAKQRYPVVYLLDGDAHFSSVVGMIQQLSTVNGNMICPEMIVVGIPNTNRTRDLTPTHVNVEPPFMDSASSKSSGGGEKFISFIEKELIPYIDAHYPTEPYKILIGHSFGGLMVMQTFVHHTNLFNSYICIDPSMWWDKQILLKETKKVLANTKFQGTSIFLGIANTMEDGMTINKVLKDTSGDSRHIRSILKLRSYFEKNTQNSLKYQGKYYNDDSHGSVPLITEYDALHFLFNFYPLKISFREFTDSTADLVNTYEKHFSTVSKQMGYKIKPSENLINGMGYQALGSKQFQKARRFFKYNIDNYPESYNVYDSMGDYYVAIGDKFNAINNFEKALSIKQNADTREKLEKLQSK